MKSSRMNAFIIIIIVLAVAVVLYALFGHSTSIDTAKVILPTPIAGGEDNGGAGNNDTEVSLAEVTPETVQAAIGTLNRAESYSRTVTVEEFWNGGSRSSVLSEWVSGGSTKISTARGGDVLNVLLAGETIYIWYDNTEGVYIGSTGGKGAEEADVWLRSLTYEDLLAMPADSITGAGYQEYAGESCIFAEYLSGNFGYRNIVYVSVNTGILMGAETYDGEMLIYRMTSVVPDTSVPDARYFEPPENAG